MIPAEFDIEGKTAIVTGASDGIGKAVALTLAESGAHVAIAARSVGNLEETAAEVRRLGRRCLVVPTDVRKVEAVQKMIADTLSEFGKIDILVNNAGIAIPKAVYPLQRFTSRTTDGLDTFEAPITEEEWYLMMDTNLKGAFFSTQAVIPVMKEQNKGKIIIMSSINAIKPEAYHSLYCMSKSALSMFTRVMALELSRFNINVNAIGPGRFRTRMSARQHDDPELRARMLQDIPMRRTGNTRDIGLLAVYLASPASDYMTGQTLFLDGGLTLV